MTTDTQLTEKHMSTLTSKEANDTLRGLIKTLCEAIGEFSDSEACELIEDDPAVKDLFEAMERVQICANSIPTT